jgi:hypothetical protein
MVGPQAQLFQIGALAVTAHMAGWLISLLGLPSLLGMMLVGIALRNVDFIDLTGGYLEVAATLRYDVHSTSRFIVHTCDYWRPSFNRCHWRSSSKTQLLSGYSDFL